MRSPEPRDPAMLMVSQLRRELDALVEELVSATETLPRSGWVPRTDVLETEEAILVVLEVPGVAADDLRIDLEPPRVVVRGRRSLCFPRDESARFHCLERQEGTFSRHLEVLRPVDFARADATLANGLLVLVLPRLEERRRLQRTVPIIEREEA